MKIDFDSLSASNVYHLMTQTIIPRPIAWILSDNGDGSHNLAPFSYFNAICSDPPLVMFSVGKKPDGGLKDTRVNIEQRKQLVVHIPTVAQAQPVMDSSATLPHGESEVERLNLPLVSEAGWPLPRLADAAIAMACEFHDVHYLGPNEQAIFYCKVNQLYVSDEVTSNDAKGRVRVDANKVAPLGRLGGGEFATFGETFSLHRPK